MKFNQFLFYSLFTSLIGLFLFSKLLHEIILSSIAIIILISLYHELNKLNKQYRILNNINIFTNKKDFCNNICKQLVVNGGFSLSWIGIIKDNMILPKYYFGENINYLNSVFISIDKNLPESQGPSGRCLNENEIIYCQDIFADETTLPWRKKIAQFGWKSACAIPVRNNGIPIGVLIIYSKKKKAFTQHIKDILNNLMEIMDYHISMFNNYYIMSQIFNLNTNAVIITDKACKIINVNQKFTDITGYEKDFAVGKNPNFLSANKQNKEFYKNMWDDINTKGYWDGELYNKRENGEIYLERLYIFKVLNDDEEVNYIGIFFDMNSIKDKNIQLDYLKEYDQLTGLHNYNYIEKYFNSIIKPFNDCVIAVLTINVDKCKFINSTLGYYIGDILLKEITNRITKIIQLPNIVGRINYDEFIAIIFVKNINEVEVLCKKLTADCKYTILNERELYIPKNIGISLYNTDSINCEELVRFSNLAMILSKQTNKHFCFYDENLVKFNQQIIDTEIYLKRALHNNEITILYQPILNSKDNEIQEIEILCKWYSTEFKNFPPNQFISISESVGLLSELTDYILYNTFSSISDFPNTLNFSINISNKQLKDPNFINKLSNYIDIYKLQPNNIYIELTEWENIHLIDNLEQYITELKLLGIKLTIDNFGIDSNNLIYLKKYHIDRIKIDSAFLDKIEIEGNHRLMYAAILNIAKQLNIEVVAKGIESKQQFDIINNLGCELFQGYYISMPMTKNDCIDFLDNLI